MSDTADFVLEKGGVDETRHVENGPSTIHVVKNVHADGTIDLVDAHAVGGEFQDMPKGYYTSISFIMTVVVSSHHP